MTEANLSKSKTEKYPELLLPRREDVVISDSMLLRKTVRLEDFFGPHFYESNPPANEADFQPRR